MAVGPHRTTEKGGGNVLAPFPVFGQASTAVGNRPKEGVLYKVYTWFIPNKTKTADNQMIISCFEYPDPGSNRDGFYSTGV